MSGEFTTERAAVRGIRVALGIGGVLALATGILILFQPARAAAIVTLILGIYAIAVGLVYGGIGIFSKAKGGWSRIGHVLLGIVFIIAGIVAFTNSTAVTVALAIFVTVAVGIAWIIEGVVSLSTLGFSPSKGWTVFFAIISIIAGVYLLISPLWGAFTLWWLLGIMLAVMGIMNIIRAFTFGK